jgi:hypothetical protein
MTTLAQLADRCQLALADSGAVVWDQTTVESWVKEGLRDYNIHLPRRRLASINVSAGTRKYDLPDDFRELLSVEYPSGEDPPVYLERRSHRDDNFWGLTGYYDVIYLEDATDQSQIWISETPGSATGVSMSIIYQANHDLEPQSATTLTIPVTHEPIVIEFVIWRAWIELLAAEQQSPTSNSSLLMSQYASNADRQKRSYVQALARALRGREGKSARVQWSFDKWDRVY